jgi:predicted nucleotidyltransferase
MIDLPPAQLEQVKRILSEYVPGCAVWVFGSRIRKTAKAWSDLDLAIVGADRLERDVLGGLREAFEESGLPIRIDVLDWHAISPEFRVVIKEGYEVLQESSEKI